MADDAASFGPSKLGTKEYWDEVYKQELFNFKESGDIGEVWFGHSSVDRVVGWIEKHDDLIPKEARLLDIGCGNGALLTELAQCGFTNLIGVDYSEGAIDLAKSIAEKENLNITYQTCDFLDPEDPILREEGFDVCLDKGTFDAISLSTQASDNMKKYIRSVVRILKSGGYLIITSCNWTGEELKKHFHTNLEFFSEVPVPKFTFGGKTGSTTTTLIFQKAVK